MLHDDDDDDHDDEAVNIRENKRSQPLYKIF